jgi:hypothetical protein
MDNMFAREWMLVDGEGNLVFPEAWLLAQPGLARRPVRRVRMLGAHIRANADLLEQVTPNQFAFFRHTA